jgi:hypothetical protein
MFVVWLAISGTFGAACTPAAATPSASTPESGIRGTVLLAPTCPVEVAGATPCVTPYAAVLVITDSEGREVSRVTAAADGSFQVRLPPGDYVILPQPGDPFPTAQPLDVVVVPGEFAEVQVNYDTGIR